MTSNMPVGLFFRNSGNVVLTNKEDIVKVYNDGCYGSSASSASLKPLFMRENRRRFRDLDADPNWVEPWKLNLLESFYLASQGKLRIVVDGDCELSIDEMWTEFGNSSQYHSQKAFACYYGCFESLKQQGWVVKQGQTYGCHFTVYLGDPDRYHSQFCVLVRDALSATPLPWIELTREMRVAQQTGKEVIMADISLKEDASVTKCQYSTSFAIMLRWILKHDEAGKERKPHAKLAKKLTMPTTKQTSKKKSKKRKTSGQKS